MGIRDIWTLKPDLIVTVCDPDGDIAADGATGSADGVPLDCPLGLSADGSGMSRWTLLRNRTFGAGAHTLVVRATDCGRTTVSYRTQAFARLENVAPGAHTLAVAITNTVKTLKLTR